MSKKQQSKSKNFKSSKPNREIKDQNFPIDDVVKSKKSPIGKTNKVHNDAMWYALSDLVLKDAASFPFSKYMGSKICGDGGDTIKWQSVYRVLYRPTFGSKNNIALRKATMAFYSYMRQANSGARNYEGPDLFVYLLSAFSITQCLAIARRIAGSVGVFSIYNSQLSESLVAACGGNFNSYSKNMADFRKKYNELVHQFNANLHIPKDYSYFNRQGFLLNNVFVSCEGTRFQTFAMLPDCTFKFRADATNGSALEVVPFLHSFEQGREWDYYLNLAENLMNALIINEDIQIMSGDIWKAYGDANTLKISEYSEDYQTPIVRSDDFDLQFRNMFYPPNNGIGFANNIDWNESELAIYQKDAIIYTCPCVYNDNDSAYSQTIASALIDINSESPTPAEIMEATRFVSLINDETMESEYKIPGHTDSYTQVQDIACGTEVIIRIDSYDLGVYSSSSPIVATKDSFIGSDSRLFVELSPISQSRICPIFKGIVSNEDMEITYTFGRLHNCRFIEGEDIRQLHYSAILGLLDVPVYSVK